MKTYLLQITYANSLNALENQGEATWAIIFFFIKIVAAFSIIIIGRVLFKKFFVKNPVKGLSSTLLSPAIASALFVILSLIFSVLVKESIFIGILFFGVLFLFKVGSGSKAVKKLLNWMHGSFKEREKAPVD